MQLNLGFPKFAPLKDYIFGFHPSMGDVIIRSPTEGEIRFF